MLTGERIVNFRMGRFLRGKFSVERFRTPEGIHTAIVGAISFAFIAAGIVPYLPALEPNSSLVILLAAGAGTLLGKVFVI
jgi:hypothetical protein